MVIPWKVASWLATGFTSRSQVTKPTTYCCSEWWCWSVDGLLLRIQYWIPKAVRHGHGPFTIIYIWRQIQVPRHNTIPILRQEFFCSIFLNGLGKAKVTQYRVDMWLLHAQQNKFTRATHFLKSTFWWIRRQSISQYSCVPLCIVNKLLANLFSQCYTIWLLYATIYTLPDTWITLSSSYMYWFIAEW